MEEDIDVSSDNSDLNGAEINKPLVVRRPQKSKKKRKLGKQYEVEVIKATVGITKEDNGDNLKRVAAYCRVSTEQEAQSSSYELQVQYYTDYIASKEGWVLVGIYADEGISGTQMKHREQLLQMVEDCRQGKIDMVLTKSISRFSRNVVDCLTMIRELKGMNPPVEVYFEKERLSSLDDKTDMVLSLMASIAQEESRSISANISWAIRKRMENGTQKITTSSLLGYSTDEDGQLVVVEDEATIIRYIYKNFIHGTHPVEIAKFLNKKGLTTILGNSWNGNSVKGILRNEKYCGDVLMQKTFTVDYLTHKVKKNEGERDQFYIADHHEPIVSREVWDKAQFILERLNYKNWKRGNQQRLIPIEKGLLMGFVSISQYWKEISIVRLQQATTKLMNGESGQIYEIATPEEREEEIMPDILKGFEEIDLEFGRSDSVMTIVGSTVKFNKPTTAELMFPNYVRMMVNANTKQIAIQSCNDKKRNAIEFIKPGTKPTYSISIKVPAIVVAIRKLIPNIAEDESYSFTGKLFADEKTIIYDLNDGKPTKKRNKKKNAEQESKPIEE